jgi:sigma-54 dependent transcriptional regulator of gfr operon
MIALSQRKICVGRLHNLSHLKERILDEVNTLSQAVAEPQELEITARRLCDIIPVQRNTISHYLNALVDDGKLIKVNTRPVLFYPKSFLEKNGLEDLVAVYDSTELLFAQSQEETDPFDNVIGAHESLFSQIKQLKAAARYPGVGLPVLLTGPTGSGKSFLARVFYDYCVASGLIGSEGRFVHLNCAEYADNPELLASNLFGYKKGTFTGADSDKAGLFDAADHGMLFLDEVHRLSAKGQEKLFEYLDTGRISPLGETHSNHPVQVRLIFATTENIQSSFLQTFIRRIPVQIQIPSLNNRSKAEKESLAKFFLLKHAKKTHQAIHLTNHLLTEITNEKFESNVGQLKNNVTLTVANALLHQHTPGDLTIKLNDLPTEIWESSTAVADDHTESNQQVLTIRPTDTLAQLITGRTDQIDPIAHAFEKIGELYQYYGMTKSFTQASVAQINTLCDILVYEKTVDRSNIPLSLLKKVLASRISSLEDDLDIALSGNFVVVLAYYFYHRQAVHWAATREVNLKEVYTALNNQHTQIWGLVDQILESISNALDIQPDIVDRLFLYLYFLNANRIKQLNRTRCIVLAHGFSTASSIATVVNKMLGENVVDGIDMPLNIQVDAIGEKVTEYISHRTIRSGLMLLVDMGSLEGIDHYINCQVDFPIGVISNVSTQSALVVGENILQHRTIQDIVAAVNKEVHQSTRILYPDKLKKNLIITCCNTGIGTAIQIKQLLDDSFLDKFQIVVNAYDYTMLHAQEQIDALKKTFNILAVVGTVNPDIADIPFISLEDLISGQSTDQFGRILKPVANTAEITRFNENVLRNFSIERVLNSLTILDARTVMKNIDLAMAKFQEISNIQLSNKTRMALYVHVSCLIERLIRNEPITTYDWSTTSCDTELKDNIQQAFSVMEALYSVKIPDSEIGYIYDIIAAND